MVIAMLRSDEEETSKLSEQGQKEAGSNGQPVHFVACVAQTNHKCIARYLASKENSRAETLRGRQSAHQWHVHGCELLITENNTEPPMMEISISQTLGTLLILTKRQCAIKPSQGLLMMCPLLQFSKRSSSIFQSFIIAFSHHSKE